MTKIADGRVSLGPFPEMLDTIRCLRAEGIKTAILTNNWFLTGNKSLMPLDPALFNVVCTDLSNFYLTCIADFAMIRIYI